MARQRKAAGKKIHSLSGEGPWLVGDKEDDDDDEQPSASGTPQSPRRMKSGKSITSSGGRPSGGSRDDLLADDLLAYHQGIEDATLERLSDEEHRASSLLWQSTSSAVSLPSMPSLLPSRAATVEDGEEERMMREGEERLRKLDSLWQQLNIQLHVQEKLLESHERGRVDSLSAEERLAWEDEQAAEEESRREAELLAQQQVHAVREQHDAEEELLLQMGEELGEGDDDDGAEEQQVQQKLLQPAAPSRQASLQPQQQQQQQHLLLQQQQQMLFEMREMQQQVLLQQQVQVQQGADNARHWQQHNQEVVERQEREAKRDRAQEEANRRVERRLRPRPRWRGALWWLVKSTWKHALWLLAFVMSHVVRSWWSDGACAQPQPQLQRVTGPEYEL